MNTLYHIALLLITAILPEGYSTYFVIPCDWAEAHSDMFIEPNKFGYTTTVDGRCVCSTNSALDFKDTFNAYQFPVDTLGAEDFPQDTTNTDN